MTVRAYVDLQKSSDRDIVNARLVLLWSADDGGRLSTVSPESYTGVLQTLSVPDSPYSLPLAIYKLGLSGF